MTSSPKLSRALRILSRPLWQEDEGARRERTCRLILSIPFAVIAGGAYGVLMNRAVGGGMVPGALLGSMAFVLFFHLQSRLTPVLQHFMEKWGAGAFADLAEMVLDGLAGGLVALVVVDLMGAPVITTVATVTALGAGYAILLGALLCGRGIDQVLGHLLGAPGGGATRRTEYSYAAAMTHQGNPKGAAEVYNRMISEAPMESAAYFHLAKLFTDKLDEPREAIRTLSLARERARLTEEEEILVYRRIIDLWRFRLGEERRAAPELARLVERFGAREVGVWAKRELEEIKDEVAREMDRKRDEEDLPSDP